MRTICLYTNMYSETCTVCAQCILNIKRGGFDPVYMSGIRFDGYIDVMMPTHRRIQDSQEAAVAGRIWDIV